VGDGAGVG
jgi:hypothetical protein